MARVERRDGVVAWCAAGAALGLVLAGCDAPVVGPTPGGAAPAAAPARPGAAGRPGAGGANAADGGAADPPPLALSDGDFNETDRTRDPFRSFAREFVPAGPPERPVENTIKLREYPLEELRLVAVIIGSDNPYAMLVDRTGRGTIIRRGEYVGRPETVPGVGENSTPHQVPWRVARIVSTRVRRDRDNNLLEDPGEVVFEREDRLNPTAEHVERSLTLDPAAAAAARQQDPAAAPGLSPLPTASSVPAAGGMPYLPPALGGAPGARGGPPMPGVAGAPGSGQVVQQYTTIVPPTPAQAAPPTTVVIQTTPQGQVSVGQPGSTGAASAPAAAQRPRDPYAAPPGGSNAPPPVTVTGGGAPLNQPMPSSGLSP